MNEAHVFKDEIIKAQVVEDELIKTQTVCLDIPLALEIRNQLKRVLK